MKSLITCSTALVLALPLCAKAEPATTRAAVTRPITSTAPAVPTTVVKRGSLPLKFDANGYFEPVDPVEIRLRFKQYAGELTINAVVANGSLVKKGDKLLEIDPVPLKKQLDAAENDLAMAKANLEKTEADYKLSEASEAFNLKTHQDALKDAEKSLEYWEKIDGPQMIRQWDLELKRYQELVDDRAEELDQLKKMYKSEELTSATADIVVRRALHALENAKAGFEMEKERIDKDKAFYYQTAKRAVVDALTKAKQGLASHLVAQEHVKAQWKSILFTSRAAVATAAQKTSELQGDLDKLTVIAPQDGIVWYGQLSNGNWFGGDAKAMKVGEKLAAGSIPLTLYAPGKLHAIVDLQEAKYFSVPAGTKATITPSAFPGLRIEGVCDAAARTGVVTQDRGVVYPLRISTGDVDERIIAGMKAAVKIDVAPAEGILLVPTTAVSNGEVWVKAKSGSEKKRSVVTGRTDGKSIEIVSGLKEGEEVLTTAKGGN